MRAELTPTHPANGALDERSRERHIICVDDDPDFLKSLEVFLPERINAEANSGYWYRFLFFSDPREAIETLHQLKGEGETLAMVISDQKMPKMKGTELLAEVQRISSLSIRVLLTGNAGIESAVQAINERLLDKYLTKPIEDAHGFALNIMHLVQGFEMRRTIEAQSEVISDLYDFANRLNAIEDLESTLEAVTAFTARSLKCGQAFVLARDALGKARDASIGLTGPVALWLGPTFEEVPDETVGQTSIRCVRDLAGLRPWILDEREAIRQSLQFPILLAPLSADGKLLGWIGASALATDAGEGAQQILSYISDTASIAVRNMQGRERLKEAYATIQADAFRLTEANRRLLLLDEMRGEFLAFISHELSTPLSMMAAVNLLDETSPDPKRTQLVEAIRHGYTRLNLLVKKALAYFAWLSRAPEWSEKITRLDGVVTSVLVEYGPAQTARIEVALPESPCPARIPAQAAETIVKILLDNAVKFSAEGTPIRVTVDSLGDEVVLTVADRGRGFPSEWGSELFRPFTVADTLHHHRGSGLNLAIAALIAQAFRGSMEGRSDGWGQGATFVVRLPSDSLPIPDESPTTIPAEHSPTPTASRRLKQ